MKKRLLNNIKASFALLLLMMPLLSSAVMAQTQADEDPEQVMTEAYGLYLNGQIAEGIRTFQDVAERYRGTEAGYKALNFLVSHTDDEQTRVYLQQIVSGFPNTIYETKARADLLAYDFDRDHNKTAFLQGCDEMAQELGGPTLGEIVTSWESPDLSAQIRILGADRQQRLLKVYSYMGNMVGSQFQDIPGDVADHQAKTKILYFLHRTFTPLGIGYDGLLPIYRNLPADIGNSLPSHPLFVDPIVLFKSPSPNSTTGARPMITAELTTGDFTKQDVSLQNLSATLDGQDVKKLLDFQVNFGEPQIGEIFVTTDLSFQPTTPLTSGRHQFVLEVPVEKYPGEGPGKTVATLDFFVQETSENTSLAASQDSILTQKIPHRNEGANPVLTLEKVQGKATRTAVAFDLGQVNLSGLTKATLRLTVDPSQHVDGWGNGETVSVSPLTTPWSEGNGKSFGLTTATSGSGAGVTWFSAVDTDISNDFANSSSSWNGGSTAPGTAASVTITNHYTGTVDFDVTQDLLNGQGQNGWLVFKNQENKGSKVSFYSKEGANASGNQELAPTLILEYGSPSAQSSANGLESLLAGLGLRSELSPDFSPPESELPSLRERLRNSPATAWAIETVAVSAIGPNPAGKLAIRTAYHLWLEHSLV